MDKVLNDNEQLLLHRLQMGIPTLSRPFHLLGEELHVNEKRIIETIQGLIDNGIIRWFGAIFSTRTLGYKSTLAALSLPPDRLEEAALVVNQHPGVTHNYQRPDEYNLWFTIAVSKDQQLDEELKHLAHTAGATKWLNLPVLKTYKIALILPLSKNSFSSKILGRDSSDTIYSLTSEEKDIVRLLQENWPIVPEPFKVFSKKLHKQEEILIDKVNKWINFGIIRRIAPIVKHVSVGFTVNWMVAWQLREDYIDIMGERAAQNMHISHCYKRAARPDWPYSLYTMIHARSNEEAEETVTTLRTIINPIDFKILPTIKEFKKTRLKLFL
ncbi:MAG: hypothetical protein ACMUJM_23985 [bacterium]